MSDEQLNALRAKNEAFKQQPTPINPAFGMAPGGEMASSPTDFLSANEVAKAGSVANNQFAPEDPSGRMEGDPGFVERTKTWGASVMASLFDYSDTEEKIKNNENVINNPMDVIETGWDMGVLWPLFKMYERINQAGSYAGAAFPGGIDKLSWDEAGTISPGQVATLNAETALTDPSDPANALNLLATGSSLAGFGLAPILGSLGEDGELLPDDFQNDPTQFLNKQRQEEVFGEGRAQLVSGAYDFIWALVVDPLLFVPAGKAVKFARLRFIDQGLKTTDDYTRAQNALVSDAAAMRANPEMDAKELSGFGQNVRYVQSASETEFIEFTSRNGNQDIWESVRGIGRTAFGQTLDRAGQYELGTLILRAQGLGDERALKQLVDSNPGITKLLIQSAAVRRAQGLTVDGAATQNTFNKKMEQVAQNLEDAVNRLEQAPEGSPAKVAAQQEFERVFNDFFDITSSDNPMKRVAELASLSINGGSAKIKEIFRDVQKFEGQALKDLYAIANSADDTIGKIARYNRGLTGDMIRVGNDGALGRANQARRLKNVDKTASIVPYSGSIRTALSEAYDVGTWNGVRMTLRLWRLPGVERPAGLINLRGLKGADNLREIRATIFSTRTFAGAAKVIDGKKWGGRERGEEILEAWLRKYDQADMDGAKGMQAFRDLEDSIAKEVWGYNTASARGTQKIAKLKGTEKGLRIKSEDDLIKMALEEANSQRMYQQGKLERGQAYWMDGDEIQAVPISDAQLADSVFMYNFKAFEDSLLRSDASLMVRRSVLGVYQAFNDLWRPAVLFRLGYPIRNVGEGLIRASLYEMSFRPIIDAFRAGKDGAGNLVLRPERKEVRRQQEITAQLLEEAGDDPAAIRAVRDKKFQRWLKSEIAEAEIRLERAKESVIEARRVLEEVKKDMPEATFLDDVEPALARIRGQQGTAAGDVSIPKASVLLQGKVRVTERKRPGDAGAQQGVFGDNSGYGIEYADFLPSGQVLLGRSRQTATKKRKARKKSTIVVKTPGNLLGGKGYKFDPNKRFTIKSIDEKNKTITFTAGSKTFTEPIEILESAQDVTAVGKLKEVIDANNQEFVRLSTIDRGKKTVQEFDRTFRYADMPQVGIARTASGDVDEYMMRQYGEAVDNVDTALRIESEMRERLIAVSNTKTAIRKYAQQRVQRHRLYASEIAQDLGSNVVTALVKGSDSGAFNPDNPFASVATDAASATSTTRAQLSLDSRINANMLRASTNKKYQSVRYDPSNPTPYFRGQATQLQQMYDGYFGRAVMLAKTEVVEGQLRLTDASRREILKLFNTEQGRAAWRFLSGSPDAKWAPSQVRRKSTATTRSQLEIESQSQYLDELLRQFERLTPSGELRARIQQGSIKPSKEATFLSDVTRLNGSTDLTPKSPPVIGDIEMLAANPARIREATQKVSQTIFKYIGQLPEDAFVRMPFYGRRYREVFNQRVRLASEAAEANGRQMISGRELGDIVTKSHQDALRETKRYLYTIERRTWLGDNFEKVMPFISAGQNAVQAVGRLTSRDPSAAAMIVFLWSRPYASGDIVDENNEVSLAWTESMLPGWLKKSGLSDVGIDLGSINLLFPETGYGLIHRPGPVVTVPAGEMMKRGWILQPYAPATMKAVFGEEFSEQAWVQFQKYLFGDSGGPAPSAVRAVLPAWMVKTLDIGQKENSKAYAYALDSNVRGMMAEVQAGEREWEGEEALWEEARDRTNGWFIVRLAFNLASPTSPKLHPTIEPLVDEYRHYQQQYGRDADRLFNEVHGPNLAYIGSAKGSKNLAGVDATTEAAERAAKYAGLTAYLGSDLADNPDLLGVILNSPDPDAEYVYNASVLRQQENQKIPGLSRTYRSMQTPQESLLSSSTGAGWTEYLRFRERIESTAKEMGLDSYQESDELMYYMKQKRAQMASDPMYAGWYQAYLDNGNSRLEGTLKIMRKLTGSNANAIEYAMDSDNAELVNGMQEYLTARDQMLEMERQSGSGLGADVNRLIMEQWQTYIRDLKMRNRTFAAFWERYLYGDMNGLTFEGVSYDSYAGGVLNG